MTFWSTVGAVMVGVALALPALVLALLGVTMLRWFVHGLVQGARRARLESRIKRSKERVS